MKRSKNFARNKKVYTSTYIAGATYEARHKFVNFYYIFFVAHVLTKQPCVWFVFGFRRYHNSRSQQHEAFKVHFKPGKHCKNTNNNSENKNNNNNNISCHCEQRFFILNVELSGGGLQRCAFYLAVLCIRFMSSLFFILFVQNSLFSAALLWPLRWAQALSSMSTLHATVQQCNSATWQQLAGGCLMPDIDMLLHCRSLHACIGMSMRVFAVRYELCLINQPPPSVVSCDLSAARQSFVRIRKRSKCPTSSTYHTSCLLSW